MKQIIGMLLVLVLLSSVAFAQEQSSGEKTAAEAGKQIAAEMRYELKSQTTQGVRELVQERKEQIEQEIQGLEAAKQNAYKNQNEVRLAVHSLLTMENLVGGIGSQVRVIARDFNNSIQTTLRVEERVEARSRIARFFAGGDEEAAAEIEVEVFYNREKIQKLKQLREDCECSEEVKDMMQEQIQSIEQEQDRLDGLVQAEKKSKGLFGWIWK